MADTTTTTTSDLFPSQPGFSTDSSTALNTRPCFDGFGQTCTASTQSTFDTSSTAVLSIAAQTDSSTLPSHPSFTRPTGSGNFQPSRSTSTIPTTFNAQSSTAVAAATPSPAHAAAAQKGIFLNLPVVIGAAVGCFAVGVVLAGIACFWLFRKRKQPRITPSSYVSLGSTIKDLDAPEKHASTVKTTPVTTEVLDTIAQQADDTTVRHRISALAEQIRSHVENFYEDVLIEISPALEIELSRFETSQLSASLATCFRSCDRPTVLIQHCIAFHVFNLTVAPGEGITPLIANELAEIVAANQYAVVSSSAPHAAVRAYSQWKSLTAYLLPHLVNDDGGPLPAEQLKTVARIASHFSTVFEPWANQDYTDAHRSRHLVKLVEQAVKTATWFFSQPDCYKFEWTIPVDFMVNGHDPDNEQIVVVAPSMTKMTQGGESLRNPQNMLDVIVKTV